MIIIFIATEILLAAAYYIASQYIFSELLLIAYLGITAALAVEYFQLERRRRAQLVRQISDLFDREPAELDVTCDSELSSLERKVSTVSANALARERAVDARYESIASLVSDISHQCKTPLSSVLMYAELPPSSENQAAILQSAEKLNFLLDALSKLSRIEGGLIAENLHPCECSVNLLVCNAVNAVISSASAKDIELSADLPDELNASFDLRWTGEALSNLLDNAVKYSPTGSTVKISAVRYELFVRIDVADEGPGIPEAELPKIWQRFYRGKIAANSPGVGIGLYLSRAIVNSEGGRLVVSSSPAGSVFSMFLSAVKNPANVSKL